MARLEVGIGERADQPGAHLGDRGVGAVVTVAAALAVLARDASEKSREASAGGAGGAPERGDRLADDAAGEALLDAQNGALGRPRELLVVFREEAEEGAQVADPRRIARIPDASGERGERGGIAGIGGRRHDPLGLHDFRVRA